jgi:hypothetical protein
MFNLGPKIEVDSLGKYLLWSNFHRKLLLIAYHVTVLKIGQAIILETFNFYER